MMSLGLFRMGSQNFLGGHSCLQMRMWLGESCPRLAASQAASERL